MGQTYSTALPNGNKNWTPELRWEVKRFIERRLERNMQHKAIFIETAKEFGRSIESIRTLWRDINNGNADLPDEPPVCNADEPPMTAAEFGLNPGRLDFCNLGQAISAIESDFNRMARGHRGLQRQVKEMQETIDQLHAEKEQLAENQMDNSLLLNQHLKIEELEIRIIELTGELEVWQQLAGENEAKARQYQEATLELEDQLSQSKAQLDAIFASARDHFLNQQQHGKAKLERIK
ncbi:hypothetical protein SAMN02799624_05347 [Paenibacillus sp. UNC496MF]|uniref:hypothetical protein n=1 Tax=Paenibacillus sp. UNC496MF TaxID=1502753 RepID=UPI0008EFCE00|nr:hypothetical protein [Paenibacillus sp. UNC496MF]SFJ64523.1 hypothetical protein SAMN02799624_05347 [Paenibacillus sp. UNC496MF]